MTNKTAFGLGLTGASAYFLAYKAISYKKHLVKIVEIKNECFFAFDCVCANVGIYENIESQI